jgi:opacity protein-like surface antigen
MRNQVFAAVATLLLTGPLYAQSSPSSKVGPFIRAEAGFSKAVNPHLRDDDPSSANCFLISATFVPPCTGELDKLGKGKTLGVGVGYRFPGGIRADVSYNRRSGLNLQGADPAGTFFDPPVKSDTVMLNGTFDIPVKLGPVSPYVGFGIGRTKNDMKPINWFDPGCCAGTLTGGKKNDTAWQFTLGGDIDLTGGWVLELAYRYTDLGKIVKHAGPDQAGLFGTGVTGSATGKLRTNELLMAVRFGF